MKKQSGFIALFSRRYLLSGAELEGGAEISLEVLWEACGKINIMSYRICQHEFGHC